MCFTYLGARLCYWCIFSCLFCAVSTSATDLKTCLWNDPLCVKWRDVKLYSLALTEPSIPSYPTVHFMTLSSAYRCLPASSASGSPYKVLVLWLSWIHELGATDSSSSNVCSSSWRLLVSPSSGSWKVLSGIGYHNTSPTVAYTTSTIRQTSEQHYWNA